MRAKHLILTQIRRVQNYSIARRHERRIRPRPVALDRAAAVQRDLFRQRTTNLLLQ